MSHDNPSRPFGPIGWARLAIARDFNRHAGESQSSEGPRLPTEFDVRADDEPSLAVKVAKFPQHKRDKIFAGYTQADFASLDFDWNFWGGPEQIAPSGTTG